MKRLKKNDGFSIMSMVVSLAILLGGMTAVMQAVSASTRSRVAETREVMAQQYVDELLEYFRSLSSQRLLDYLKINPINASSAAYSLCAHINIADRAGARILNADPLADLPTSSPLNFGGEQANRYYQVSVVDLNTLARRSDLCDLDPATVSLGADERFFVTVGVSWVDKRKNVRSAVASTLIPDGLPQCTVKTAAANILGYHMPLCSGSCTGTEPWGSDGSMPLAPLMTDLTPGERLYATNVWGIIVNRVASGQSDQYVGCPNSVSLQFSDSSGNRIDPPSTSHGRVPLSNLITQGIEVPAGATQVWGDFTDQTYSDNEPFAAARTATSTGGCHFTLIQSVNCAVTCNPSAVFNVGSGFNGDVASAWALPPEKGCGGGVYVGGNFTQYNGAAANRIVKLKADGSIDGTFDTGTGALAGFNNSVSDLTTALDGSNDVFVVGNFTSYKGSAAPKIARIQPNGSLNPVFNPGTGATGGEVYPIEAIDDGSGAVFIGGTFTGYNGNASAKRIAYVNSNGTLNTSFITSRLGNATAGFNSDVYVIMHLAGRGQYQRGPIYVGGAFTQYDGNASVRRFVRLNYDGTVDNTFAANNQVNGDVYTIEEGESSAAASGDRLIYVGGSFTTIFGGAANGLARLKIHSTNAYDGVLDASFSVGSGFKRGLGVATIYYVTPVKDGTTDIYVSGDFTSYRGVAVGRIARLSETGALVSSFNPGTGANAPVSVIVTSLDGLGNAFVAGAFTQMNGGSANRFIRLSPLGIPN